MQVSARAQRPHFVDQTGVEHRRESLADPRVQPGTIERLERDQRRWLGARPFGVPGRERPAADAVDFERALDPLRVVRREPGGGHGIDRRQLGVQCRPALTGGARIDLGANRGIGLRHGIEPVEQRLVVEHRPADQER